MSGTCSRCGRAGEVEYGSDGQSYCSACIFYGLNKQCWRCRMYLPASELQQYRGQWACPYCIQDMREADRKASEYHPEKPHLDILSYPETCERCGRDLKGRVYIWNGKRLCKNCLSDEQSKWGLVGGGPMGASQRITLEPEQRAKEKSFFERALSDLLGIVGMKRKKKIEIMEYKTKMPIQNAKPMAETGLAGKVEKKPQAEGLMGMESKPVVKEPTMPPIEFENDSNQTKSVKPQTEIQPAGAGTEIQNKKRKPKKGKKNETKVEKPKDE